MTTEPNGTRRNDKPAVTLVDLNAWEHPIKSFFQPQELEKVELLDNETYPLFYSSLDTLSEEEAINRYLNGTYENMLKANGFWDFEIVYHDGTDLKIAGDREKRELAAVRWNSHLIDIEAYRNNYEMILRTLTARILTQDGSTRGYFFRSPLDHNGRPLGDDNLYTISGIEYHVQSKQYKVTLLRKSDTRAIYYWAKIRDGNVMFYYENEKEYTQDFDEVARLYALRFVSLDLDAVENRQDEHSSVSFYDRYSLFVDDFDVTTNRYTIRIMRNSDTVNTYYYYDADLDKYYEDGSGEEIHGWEYSAECNACRDLSDTASFKNGMIGIWQASPSMASGWSDRYHFFEDGSYIFYYNEMYGGNRTTDESGDWEIKDNKLILNMTAHTVIEGGTVVEDEITGRRIDGGQKRNIRLKKPERKTLPLFKQLVLDLDNQRLRLELNGVRYWKFSNDPAQGE